MRTDHQRDVAADGSVEDDQFVRQLKELVSVLRDEDVDPLDQCSAVDQQCDHDAAAGDGRSCCRGLRCSAAGKCVLDCVSDGESCRHNWFCCDGRHCNRYNHDFVCE